MHTQHLRQKLDRIERDSGLDGEDLPQLTLAEVLDENLTVERVNEHTLRIVETDELRQG